jgi:hypothetical protein
MRIRSRSQPRLLKSVSRTLWLPLLRAVTEVSTLRMHYPSTVAFFLTARTFPTDDKKIQQELVGAAGLRSVRRQGGSKFSDLEPFLRSETYPVVLKPIDSAGSDGVKLCHTFEEAKDRTPSWAGNAVNGGANWCSCSGIPQGKEYVVDHSSRDGVHKTMMVWVYDKRPANGASSLCMAAFQLTRNRPRPRFDPLRAWSARCHWIQAWGFHGDGSRWPCRVEMNCRTNGGDGIGGLWFGHLTGGYTGWKRPPTPF